MDKYKPERVFLALLISTLTFFLSLESLNAANDQYQKWDDYLGSADSAQYSSLKTINKTNVKNLEQVWFYPAWGNGRFGFNPLIVDEVMYDAFTKI